MEGTSIMSFINASDSGGFCVVKVFKINEDEGWAKGLVAEAPESVSTTQWPISHGMCNL
jgi:hypothetical protein